MVISLLDLNRAIRAQHIIVRPNLCVELQDIIPRSILLWLSSLPQPRFIDG